jgi:uncharacterized pyridoxal phosphate-containing UPF0001 family protein
VYLPCPYWHDIVVLYVAIPNVFVVETVDSAKKATTLDKACATAARAEPLRIFLQVNTSGEESKQSSEAAYYFVVELFSYFLPPIFFFVRNEPRCLQLTYFYYERIGKSGMLPSEVLEVAQHVVSTCSHLKLAGLMTIGSPNPDLENGENPDFKV